MPYTVHVGELNLRLRSTRHLCHARGGYLRCVRFEFGVANGLTVHSTI
jgi:hypothetical protein